MTYFPLHVHSHYSLLDGLSKPEHIAKRCDDISVEGSALTDHGSISGHIQFLQKMQKANKKPLLGCEFYVSREDPTIKNDRTRKMDHLCVIAKNDDGWRDLVKMVSMANEEQNFYYKPRLSLEQIFEFASKGNLLAFSGHLGSNMHRAVVDEEGEISVNWKASGSQMAERFRDAFGDNFYLEVQMMDIENSKAQEDLGEAIRAIAEATGIPSVATQDAHYAWKNQAEDQRILLASQMHMTLNQLANSDMGGFSRSSQFHIPSYEEMLQWNTKEELENTLEFAGKIEDYNILRDPVLPKFDCPDGMSPDDFLRKLCRDGWAEKIQDKISTEKHNEYAERVKMELEVLQGAGLSSYFLVVQDIINYVKGNGWLAGAGRGSAAGCLVSYLIGITSIDPIQYGLIFERFYNAGRNTGGRISMPDIDMDVPKYSREKVINYLRDTYGQDHVGQMITYTTLKGRGALKAVLRAHAVDFQIANDITKGIMEESKISDELQKMKEETGDSSIIKWCLENTPKKLEEWCRIDDNGKLSGPFADKFEQAIRLEGTKSNQSKHAAGVIIGPEPLHNMFPMVLDTKTKNPVVGLEMEDAESCGGLKLDVLGVASLDKTMGVEQDLLTGEIHEIQ